MPLYHVITGLGMPLATHNKVLVSPSVKVTGAVVLRVMFGLTVNKVITNHY